MIWDKDSFEDILNLDWMVEELMRDGKTKICRGVKHVVTQKMKESDEIRKGYFKSSVKNGYFYLLEQSMNDASVDAAEFRDFYVKHVIQSKRQPSVGELDQLKRGLKGVMSDVFKMYQDAWVVELRRAPEPVLDKLVHFVKHTTNMGYCKSKEMEMFIAVIKLKIKSSKEEVRFDVYRLVMELGRSEQNIWPLCEVFLNSLQGKTGIIPSFEVRQSIISCIYGLCRDTVLSTIAEKIVDNILPICKKEAHESTKEMLFVTLGAYASFVKDPKYLDMMTEFLGQLLTPSKNKPASMPSLLALFQYINHTPHCDWAIYQGIEKLVKDYIVPEEEKVMAQGYSVKNDHHILSANILLQAAKRSNSLKVKNLFKQYAESDSGLFWTVDLNCATSNTKGEYQHMRVKTLQQITAIASAQTICGLILDGSIPIIEGSVALESLFSLLLVQDMLVHKDVSRQVHDLVNRYPATSGILLSLLLQRVFEEQRENAIIPNAIYNSALLSILPKKVDAKCMFDILPLTYLLAHHPTLSSNGKLWKALMPKFLSEVPEDASNEDAFDHLFELDSILQAFSNSLSLFLKRDQDTLVAYVHAIASLLVFHGDGNGEEFVINNVIQNIGVALQEVHLDEISATEWRIYQLPPGEVYVDENAKKNAISSRSNSSRKGRGTEEQQWEAQVREELAKKNAKNAKDNNNAGLLEQQQQIRNAVGLRVNKANRICMVVQQLCELRKEEMGRTIPFLLGPLVEIIKTNTPVQAIANVTMRALLHSISSELQHCSSQIATCIYSICISEAPKLVDFSCVLQIATSILEHHDLIPACSFHAVFVVLKALLSSPIEDVDHQLYVSGIKILYKQCSMIREEEELEIGDRDVQRLLRADIIELCLTTIANPQSKTEQKDNIPARSLHRVCEVDMLSLNEWTAICGQKGLLHDDPHVRVVCLSAISASMEPESIIADESVVCSLWCSMFDQVEENQQMANQIWDNTNFDITNHKFVDYYINALGNCTCADSPIRFMASKALAIATKEMPSEFLETVLTSVKSMFLNHLPTHKVSAVPQLVRRGEKDSEADATALPRCYVATIFKITLAEEIWEESHVRDIATFIVETGLCDLHEKVRTTMMEAGVQLVESYGATMKAYLLSVFETALNQVPDAQDKAAMKAFDYQREGTVVFMGCLAKHMDPQDAKVTSIVSSLVDALKIPSESVQRAVSNCLVPLVTSVKDIGAGLLDDLIVEATCGEQYGQRIGAAYGIAAVVKGLGISSLKKNSVLPRLEESIRGKESIARQGALFCFARLSERLGFLFEPYVIVILPLLLNAFADSNQHVRDAASEASKVIMSKLSTHGVKLVLPTLLKALSSDNAWRTKQASIQLLGSMANCAPKQLSSCLPQVVPKLMDSLSDSHTKVREASKLALQDIGAVIKNPEVAKLSPILLKALEDPNTKTGIALRSLQSTAFVHSIDAPSLALLIPILYRGLKETTGDAKKSSALIVGNMCSMITEPKDILPYLKKVLPCLQNLLMDPLPEVRSITAKSMGMLVQGVGEEHFPQVVPWLVESVLTDSSTVERAGSAQGLCEVLVALGTEKLERTLTDLLPLIEHPKFYVREGIQWVISFLSPALGVDGYAPYIERTLPLVISGLADEAESVREVSLHAGQVVVNAHAISHTMLILPNLETGVFDDSWRIRQSSVSLLGILLYKVGGTKAVGLADNDDDEGAGSLAADIEIARVLGQTRRNAVLAALFMIRSDTSSAVRQGALLVWKSVVSHSGRTLREILPTLMNSIITYLSLDNLEKRTVAGRCLGEIVAKLGDRVLPQILPIFKAGLANSPDNPPGMRQGICIGIAEIIQSAPKKLIEEFIDPVIETITIALCDNEIEVRRMAAKSFQLLQQYIGSRAVDEIIPVLLNRMGQDSEDSNMENEKALQGLQEILSTRSKGVLPYLIPKLLSVPITTEYIKALASIARVTGDVIHYHLDRIMSCLFGELVKADEGRARAIRESLHGVVLSMTNADSVQYFSVEIAKYCGHTDSNYRAFGCELLGSFCGGTNLDYSPHLLVFLRNITLRFNDVHEDVVKSAVEAFRNVNKTCTPEELVEHLEFVRTTIGSMVSDARHRKGGIGANATYYLPALCQPKSLEIFLPMYQHGLLYGSPEVRESAASGLGDLIQLSDFASLKPYLIKVTGPLIRIGGDRLPGHVKASILSTLGILLDRGETSLKPFVPQLQTTFVKSLVDSSSIVRNKGSLALGKLMTLSTRVDPVLLDLCSKSIETKGEPFCISYVESIYQILLSSKSKLKTSASPATLQLIELLSEPSVQHRVASCLSILLTIIDATTMHTVESSVLENLSTTSIHQLLLMKSLLASNPTWSNTHSDTLHKFITACLALDQDVTLQQTAISTLAIYIAKVDSTNFKLLLSSVSSKSLQHAAIDGIGTIALLNANFYLEQPNQTKAAIQLLLPFTNSMNAALKSSSIQSISNIAKATLPDDKKILSLLDTHSKKSYLELTSKLKH